MNQNYQDIVKGLKIADVSVYIFVIMLQQVNQMLNLFDHQILPIEYFIFATRNGNIYNCTNYNFKFNKPEVPFLCFLLVVVINLVFSILLSFFFRTPKGMIKIC